MGADRAPYGASGKWTLCFALRGAMLGVVALAAVCWGTAAWGWLDPSTQTESTAGLDAEPAAPEAGPGDGDAGRPSPAPPPRRTGHLVKLLSPFSVDRLRRQLKPVLDDARQYDLWPVLVFEMQSGPVELGQAIDLARFLSGPDLNGATTVAYLPRGMIGHGLLPAIACDEIVMAPDAQIGDAGKGEEAIGPELVTIYREIADRRKTVPSDLVLGMLDPAVEVLQIETEVSREFVLKSRLDEVRKLRAVMNSTVVKAAGEPGIFTGARARELGIVSYLAKDRAELARALELPMDGLQEDPSLGGIWRAVRIDVRGPISTTSVRQIERMIQEQIRRRDTNFFIFWIDSLGGSPADSIDLANFIADLDPAKRRTVAYVPREALADSAFIALACDQLAMGPEAKLGGDWPEHISPEVLADYAVPLGEIARRKYRPPGLVAAFADVRSPVYRYLRRDGHMDYFTSDAAVEVEQREPNQWCRQEEVVAANVPLQVGAERARDLGLARNVIEDFDQLKAMYGLEQDPALLEPGWVEDLIDALNSPGVAWLLLLLGGAGLYVELQSPGIGVGGFLALVCFVLFFWSHYLGGTATWLEVLLFVAGAICLLLELFVFPGFGVFGLGGGLLIIASLILASQTFVLPHDEYEVPQLMSSMLVISGMLIGFVATAIFARRFLPHVPVLNRMILEPVSGAELEQIARREALVDYSHLVGQAGVTTTPLSPSGKARIGADHLDVMTEGEFVPRGTAVTVARVKGSRIIVRQRESARA